MIFETLLSLRNHFLLIILLGGQKAHKIDGAGTAGETDEKTLKYVHEKRSWERMIGKSFFLFCDSAVRPTSFGRIDKKQHFQMALGSSQIYLTKENNSSIAIALCIFLFF